MTPPVTTSSLVVEQAGFPFATAGAPKDIADKLTPSVNANSFLPKFVVGFRATADAAETDLRVFVMISSIACSLFHLSGLRVSMTLIKTYPIQAQSNCHRQVIFGYPNVWGQIKIVSVFPTKIIVGAIILACQDPQLPLEEGVWVDSAAFKP